jgi:hypothetical protein
VLPLLLLLAVVAVVVLLLLLLVVQLMLGLMVWSVVLMRTGRECCEGVRSASK